MVCFASIRWFNTVREAARRAYNGIVPFYPPTVRYPRIFQDVPCDRCGYNLRGIHVGAQCPECGQFTFSSYNRHRARKFDMAQFTVASSDDPDKPRAHAVYKHFRKLDAAWLRKLALGTTLLLLGNVLSSAFAWMTWVAALFANFRSRCAGRCTSRRMRCVWPV